MRFNSLGVSALLGAFVVFTVCVSITPLREWTQETAVCLNAERIERDEAPGGSVRGPGAGGTGARATTVFELLCYYDGDERVKTVDNDKAFLGGAGLSILIGIVLGAVLWLLMRVRRRGA